LNVVLKSIAHEERKDLAKSAENAEKLTKGIREKA
jgi:hypothetical protein